MPTKNTTGVMENFTAAIKRCIPLSSLPLSYQNHEDLACELALELSGTVSLVDKHEYDAMVRQVRQLHRYEQAITDGMLYSPLIELQPVVVADPFKLD